MSPGWNPETVYATLGPEDGEDAGLGIEDGRLGVPEDRRRLVVGDGLIEVGLVVVLAGDRDEAAEVRRRRVAGDAGADAGDAERLGLAGDGVEHQELAGAGPIDGRLVVADAVEVARDGDVAGLAEDEGPGAR